MKCELCVKRARIAGGNGKCPVKTIVVEKRWGNSARTWIEERKSFNDSWPAHLRAWGSTGCVNFVPGDLRTYEPVHQEASLF